jgi:drug/metabolite transporter (DMT)-like permease
MFTEVAMSSGSNGNSSNATPAPLDHQQKKACYSASWWLERACAGAAGLLLTASAFGHLGNTYYFLSTIYSYQIVSVQVGYWLAFFLPFFQMIIAVILFLRRDMVITYLLAMMLFGVFFGAQWSAWSRNLDIPCGCFGTTQMKIGPTSMGMAIGGLLACVLGLISFKVHTYRMRTDS